MNKIHFLWSLLVAGMMLSPSASAQDNDFDLNSQRSEKQDVLPVSGKKIDHHGLVINPTPQQIEVSQTDRLNASQGFSITDSKKRFSQHLVQAGIKQNAKGCRLTIDFGEKAARKANVKASSGAYALTINKKGARKRSVREKKSLMRDI